jgi:hypothetical protein
MRDGEYGVDAAGDPFERIIGVVSQQPWGIHRLLDHSANLTDAGMIRDDGEHAAGGSLCCDHAEGLGQHGGNHQSVEMWQHLRESHMLEPPRPLNTHFACA